MGGRPFSGMSGRMGLESVADLVRNTHAAFDGSIYSWRDTAPPTSRSRLGAHQERSTSAQLDGATSTVRFLEGL
jgi:hypothetical protein